MLRMLLVVASVLAVGLVAGAILLDRGDDGVEPVEVVFGENDGLPEELAAGEDYVAAFVIDWSGPVSMRDGLVSVFASRSGNTSEDAPEDGWPLVCESEFDNVINRVRVACPFETPGPGEFALLLEVRSGTDEVIGEGLYTHLVVDPAELSESSG